ncbi:uncharacterized protein MELLADRAFT_105052 [Melampsora larici-populina 98AG31]|uniref:SigF-like NTF2-like domain-containing protein n=1 Tax=Melampsora larici-populina (strain 98AG31 / pathotype 3-4-7) TaxID=747676 RepID=F4RGY2_MELLP|nr:uncharacterized protein MELLADRAFT_105052 [Melampsora larici-populina 98AG31]EGG08405.1 hypothetical protein MELLADRAFT_105052 [Melampsora larici-populina 98AG31]
MNNPVKELTEVVRSITEPYEASEIIKNVDKYFTEDAYILHPIINQALRFRGKENLKGIYKFFRVMTINNKIEFDAVMFNQDHTKATLELTEELEIRLLPRGIWPRRIKFLIRVDLEKSPTDSKYRIKRQNDNFVSDIASSGVLPLPITKSKQQQQPPTLRPKTRSQTKQEQQPPIKENPANEHPKENHQELIKPSEIKPNQSTTTSLLEHHHFELYDTQDIQSYFKSLPSNQVLSLLDLLNLIASSQSSQSTVQSNVKLSIQLNSSNQPNPTNSLQSTTSLQSSNHTDHPTIKGKGKRTIEEDDLLLSDQDLINPSSPSNSNSNLKLNQNHTTPTKKLKTHKSKRDPKFDLIQLSNSTYYQTLSNPIKPELIHGLSIEIWTKVFKFINPSFFLSQIPINSNEETHQSNLIKTEVLNHLIESQLQSHQLKLISKRFLSITRTISWSCLILNNLTKIQSITRSLESNSSLSQLIKSCYLILPTHLHSFKSQSQARSNGKPNRQSMVLLNQNGVTVKEESIVRSRSSTLLTSLVTHHPSPMKPNPLYPNQRRLEPPKTPITKNPDLEPSEDPSLYILEIPSLLFSLSTNLQDFYIHAPEVICTKVLKSLSNLSHHLSSLRSLTIIGGGDHLGLFGLLNGLSLLPNPSVLKKLIISGPLLTISSSTNTTNTFLKPNQEIDLKRSSSYSIPKLNHLLSIHELWIGNGIPLTIHEICLILKKLVPNTLNRLKFNLSLPLDSKLQSRVGNHHHRSDQLEPFNHLLQNFSNSLEHLCIEEDWFNPTCLTNEKENSLGSEEGRKEMNLDEGLMSLNRLKSLDLSHYKSDLITTTYLDRLPSTLEEIKLWNPKIDLIDCLGNHWVFFCGG